jgi:hypothetical protein
VYVDLIAAFGWSWEYVDDQMTLPRLEIIWRQWKRFPPLHMMVGAYLGYGKKEAKPQNIPLDGMFAALTRETS